MSRPSPDYPMLPTIPLSAFSDPKKNKPSHGSKVSEVEGQRCGAWPLAIASHRHHHMQRAQPCAPAAYIQSLCSCSLLLR